jgi:hypothetical protein
MSPEMTIIDQDLPHVHHWFSVQPLQAKRQNLLFTAKTIPKKLVAENPPQLGIRSATAPLKHPKSGREPKTKPATSISDAKSRQRLTAPMLRTIDLSTSILNRPQLS